MQRKIEKIFFCFWDNCIWFCRVNPSLLRREYFWLAVNVFPNTPKILHIPQRGFFQLNCLHSDQYIRSRWCHSDFNSVWSHLPCCFWKGPLKLYFLDTYLTTIFGFRSFTNTWAMRVVFFLKMFKILSRFWKWKKKLRKSFFVRDNCIWIVTVKLSLLRREYLWPTFNVLAKCPKVSDITIRAFFQLTFLHSNQ